VIIRDRRPSDLPRCIELARAVKARDGYPLRGPIGVAHFLAPPDQLAAWVAEDDRQILGHIALHASSDYATTRLASDYLGCPQGVLALIARFFVDPARRRSGVGRQLLTHATDAAFERGLHAVLDVATELGPAVSLYESLEWKNAGVVVLEVFDEPPIEMHVYVAPTDIGSRRV